MWTIKNIVLILIESALIGAVVVLCGVWTGVAAFVAARIAYFRGLDVGAKCVVELLHEVDHVH